MGFTHYAQRLTDLARDAQDGRLNRQQFGHYLNQEMELAQMQFGAFGRQHGGAFSAEFSQRYRELQNVGRMMLNDPRSGLARLEGDGRSMYGSGDRFDYDGGRLDALYGSADRYNRRGDYGGTAYGSANGRYAGLSRERVDMGRGFRLPTGRALNQETLTELAPTALAATTRATILVEEPADVIHVTALATHATTTLTASPKVADSNFAERIPPQPRPAPSGAGFFHSAAVNLRPMSDSTRRDRNKRRGIVTAP